MAEVESAIELEKLQNTNSYLDFLAATQWAGNGLVSSYLIIVLRSIGINDPEEQNLINGGLTIFCYGIAIIGATTVLRFGWRKILLFGFAGMAASYLIWTILSSINQQREFKDSSLGYGMAAMILVFQLFYNISINPVLPTYILEIMPFTLCAKWYTIEQIFTYGAGLFNGFVNPVAMEALEWKYYIVWVAMLTLIYFLFLETAGRTLEEVSQIFDGIDLMTVLTLVSVPREKRLSWRSLPEIASLCKCWVRSRNTSLARHGLQGASVCRGLTIRMSFERQTKPRIKSYGLKKALMSALG
ncbi:sugar transporter [Fusarium austroafricanum]|uniref:Sugar transporter n=1 Tax=Fusarium austroafricanum TaxID=2364996 RepID=A0A8H4NGB5_9HYPO|nr:sugar transporter [Fusarium austroafricanum]